MTIVLCPGQTLHEPAGGSASARVRAVSSSLLVSPRLTSSHLVIAPFCVSFSGASWRIRGGNWIKIENVSRALLHSPRLCREPLGDTSRGHLTIVCIGHYNNCRHLPAAGAGAARGQNRLLQILKDIIWQNLMALGFRALKEGTFVVSLRDLFVYDQDFGAVKS